MRTLAIPRLLIDCVHLPELDRLVHEAEVARKLDLAAVDDALTRHAGCRGVASLRRAQLGGDELADTLWRVLRR